MRHTLVQNQMRLENCSEKDTFKCVSQQSHFMQFVPYLTEKYCIKESSEKLNPADFIHLKCSEFGKLCEKDTFECVSSSSVFSAVSFHANPNVKRFAYAADC